MANVVAVNQTDVSNALRGQAMYGTAQWPWSLTFRTQNLNSSPLTKDALLTKVWWKSINECHRYRGKNT